MKIRTLLTAVVALLAAGCADGTIPTTPTTAPARATVTALTASISGPHLVSTTSPSGWTASVSGGTAPYAYQWYKDGVAVGTGSSYGTYANRNLTLKLVVTDAVGVTSTDQRNITVDTYAGEDCYWQGPLVVCI